MLQYLSTLGIIASVLLTLNEQVAAQHQTPFAQRIQFGKRTHIDKLTAALGQRANAVAVEMHRYYQHNKGYREAAGEVAALQKDIRHIAELVQGNHHKTKRKDDHIARDLHNIDKQFHHLEEDVARWTADPTGYFSNAGRYIRNRDPKRHRPNLNAALSQLEQTIHHIMNDYGEKSKIKRQGGHQHATYKYGARAHMDELIIEYKRQANITCWEMHRYYQHNKGYRKTYNEMFSLLTSAEHIHQLIRKNHHKQQHQNDHLIRDLKEMDEKLHHVEADIARWSVDRKGYFSKNGRYISQRDPDLHNPNLPGKLENVEELLHHLMEDYGVKRRSNKGTARPSAPTPRRKK